MREDPDAARVERLHDSLRLIVRLLEDQRREDYFAALRQKAANKSGGNVTANFFGSGMI